MKKSEVNSGASSRISITVAVLVVIAAASLFLRSYFLYPQVFTPDFVRFQENDPWYHVRAVEYLVAHFPHRLTWDPYAIHPGGQYIAIGPLIDYWIASIALLLGGGSPSARLTHTVCAWFPAVLGSLTPIPLYFLGKTLLDTRAGVIAAATIAFLPGPFFKRSCLGYTDHHVAETFFSALTVLFLIHTIQAARFELPTPCGPSEHPGYSRRRTGLYVVAAGFMLGCYLLSWVGGSLFILTIFAALAFHLMIEHVRGANVVATFLWLSPVWMIALMLVIPFRDTPGFQYHIVALIASMLFMFAAYAMGWFMHARKWRRELLPIGLSVMACVGATLFWLIEPRVVGEVTQSVARFLSGKAGTFVREARPLLYQEDIFTFRPAFEMFHLTAIAAGLGAALLFIQIRRGTARGGALVLLWTLAVVLATLVQERFAYYMAVNIALLSGYFWSVMLERMRPPLGAASLLRTLWYCIGITLFIAVGLTPSAVASYGLSHKHTGPSKDWYEAMTWLRQNSPDPFRDPNFYERRYEQSTGGKELGQSKAMNSVMSSWDYGYWITTMGHRVPTANPTQSGMGGAAAFFAAQDEEAAAKILTRLDARYIVVDDELPVWYSAETRDIEGDLGTIAGLAGYGDFALYEPYLAPQDDGAYKPIVVYYPEYYRSMLNRLYLFGAEAYEPKSTTWAIRWTSFSARGIAGKLIEEKRLFSNYPQAVQFLSEHAVESWRLVGLSPFESCVTLEPLPQFQRIYRSPTPAQLPNSRSMGAVEIYEFLPEIR